MNLHEIALAVRFVEALDAPTAGEVVDPAALSQRAVFVQVRGQGSLGTEAKRLAGQLEGLHILGLPIQVVESQELPTVAAPALFLNVVLTDAKTGETRGVDRGQLLLAGAGLAAARQGVVPRQFLGLCA